MPHQVGDLLVCGGPVVGDAGDAAQRVVEVLAGGVHLADDRVLGAGHRGQRAQRRPHPVAAAVH